MSVPPIVQDRLGDESVEASISLGGEDALFITPTRSIVYRGEGLLRDESVEVFPHDAERLTFSEGRRKTKLVYEYALDGERSYTVPTGAADRALDPLLRGVLASQGVIESDESVIAAYRFSELTLVVTEDRLVKHIGAAVFDEDYEEYHYDDVTGLDFEDGSVAMQIVLTVNGRQQRIKAPNDRASEVRTRLENALWDYYDVSSADELRAKISPEEEPDDDAPEQDDAVDFGSGVDPLGSSSSAEPEAASVEVAAEAAAPAESGAATESVENLERAGFEPADSEAQADLHAEVRELRAAVDRQTEMLERQQHIIEQLIEELSRGR